MADQAEVAEPITRAELIEAILNMNHAAQREFPVTGEPDHPTPWDMRHRKINEWSELLDRTLD